MNHENEEVERGEQISKQLLPSFKVIDADFTYFYARKQGVGVIEGHLDKQGNIKKLVVEKFGRSPNKLFWGKNAIERAKKYLSS